MKAWIIVLFAAIAFVIVKNATSQGNSFTGLTSQRGTFGTSTDVGQPG